MSMQGQSTTVEAISSENQTEIPPPQNAEANEVSVTVENPQTVEGASMQHRRGSFQVCSMQIPRPLGWLIICLGSVCLLPVAYILVTVATVVILPLLIATYVVLRLIQFVVRGNLYEKQVAGKLLLRYWLFLAALLLLLEMGVLYPFARYLPKFKLVMIIGLPIAKWIKVISILILILILNQLICGVIIFITLRVITGKHGTVGVLTVVAPEIIGCLLLWLAESEVMKNVPTFKQSKIFGVYTQEWIEVSIGVFLAYNIIVFSIHLLMLLLEKVYQNRLEVTEDCDLVLSAFCFGNIDKMVFDRRYVVYVCRGIEKSIVFILCSVLLLLLWVYYFGNHLHLRSKSTKTFQFGTITLASVLLCSFLWLIKRCILLYWKAYSVYDRLHSKISEIGKQFYFLVLLSYTHFHIVHEPSTDDSADSCSCSILSKREALWVAADVDLDSEGDGYQTYKRKVIRSFLIGHIGPKAPAYDIQIAAEVFLLLQYALSKDSISRELHHLQNDDLQENNTHIIDTLKKLVQSQGEGCEGEGYFEEDWKMLLELLRVDSAEEISFQKVKTWMERAHDRCRFMVNTLISEKDVVKCLDQVISGLIIVGTFILWLLITGLATTKVLVLIVSPLLALTFIFGETCKNLFQGLIFIYIVHPFHVGDLCLIDGEMLEVKRIGVWSTIFSKVRTIGKHQEVIYPNLELATKNVINHKTEFDWNDYIEFTLSSPDEDATNNLIHQIESYLDNEEERFTPNYHSVEYLEIGGDDKIAIHIRHNVQTEGWTFFECLKEKEKRRFKFALYVRNLLNQLSSENKTSEVLQEMATDH